MCGFAGFLGGSYRRENAGRLVEDMTKPLVHRGPDDAGVWIEKNGQLALGFRRLSILDLSPAGHQPMESRTGRYVMVFNGEIYNYGELREELGKEGQKAEDGGRRTKGAEWRGHSDTEVLLQGFETWGLRRTLEKSVGMFALAVWDRKDRVLTLGRDRLGEKPLYYGWQRTGTDRSFLFGSELSALRRHPSFEGRIDRDALRLYMRYAEVPAPYSIFRGIAKLEPGCLLSVSLDGAESKKDTYWSVREVLQEGLDHPWKESFSGAADELKNLLRQSIRGQMVADVPLGAFLSGGTDSSTIVAIMQEQSAKPVRTFTVGFREAAYNEAEDARKVARHLGTEHTEIMVSPQDSLEIIPRLPEIYSEPFADSSQIPTFLISQLARQHVTVALSGDGGDELFGGYNRYRLAHLAWQGLRWMPRGVRAGLAQGLRSLSPQTWDDFFRPLEKLIPATMRLSRWGDKIHKGANVLARPSFEEIYHGLVSHWENTGAVIPGDRVRNSLFAQKFNEMSATHPVARMMATDSVTYLPDDILTKVDRASMAVSLEVRAPFLDHRLVEFAWRLPLRFKVRGSATKLILRSILENYVPRHLTERPKMGFSVPIDEWLRGPLRDWAEDLLRALQREGDTMIQAAPIIKKWREHLAGAGNWAHPLWNVLMFLAWRNRWNS